jgi:hypothetical protein
MNKKYIYVGMPLFYFKYVEIRLSFFDCNDHVYSCLMSFLTNGIKIEKAKEIVKRICS